MGSLGPNREALRMLVTYLTGNQRLAFHDKEEGKLEFYWQAELEDPWIGPFKTREAASSDRKQCCFA
jgi:hypothetical protein